MPSSALAVAQAGETLAQMIAPERTALAVIDVQRDFAAPDGAMGRLRVDLSEVEPLIAAARPVIAAARRAGATPQTDAANLKAFYRRSGYGETDVGLCREGTAGADYYGLHPEPGDIEIGKRLFSSFVGTDLEAQLQARGIDTLVLLGLTTDCCVDCTARDAFHRGLHVFLVEDLCSAYDAALHQGALAALTKNVAHAVASADVLAAWSA